MPILQSIESLDRGNIIDTQNKPVIVHASDQFFYYCKYHGHVGEAHRLFKEWLIACFLDCWNLNHASFSLLQVLGEHIPIDLGIPKRSFDTPCFALRRIGEASDLNAFTEDNLVRSKNKLSVQVQILAIAFFDIWTANEDRHGRNYNLLYTFIEGDCLLYPIDHEACFNHQNLERGLFLIDYESSLIYSPLFSKLFKKAEFPITERLENLKQRLYLCSRCCKARINDYLEGIPPGWNMNIDKKRAELERYLLNDDWFEQCWHTFLEFLELYRQN